MIQIHLQPLKILGGWRRRRASDLQGAATGDQVLNLCPYHIFGDTSSPEVLSYESTFEHFTLLFLSPEAQNELERHFPPPIIFSSVAEQPTLARTCIFA